MNSGTLRFLMLLTLAAPACGGDDETSDTSSGSSTSGGGDTTDSSGTTEPTGGTTTDVVTSDTSDTSDTADTTTGTTGSTTGSTDPTGDSTTDDTTDTTDTTTGAIADCGFDPTVAFTRDALVFQLESEDGATCVWLERRDDSDPDVIYKAIPYTLLEWKSGHAGVLTHVTDPAALTWESTHHNWTDVA
ncbi:MAG TPA: hypothetical protein VGB85_10185, partial [Nannocystis sp.]